MNRAVMARRAAANPALTKPSETRVSRNPALRVKPGVPLRAGITKSRGTKLTATQRCSDTGKASPWNGSIDYFTDPKWGQSVSNQYVGGAR